MEILSGIIFDKINGAQDPENGAHDFYRFSKKITITFSVQNYYCAYL